MLTIRTILVPVDFTETSDRALDYAVAMAARFEANVVALHAYEIPVYGFPDGALVASGEVATRISDAAQKALDRLVEARQGKGAKLTAMLRTGVAYDLANTVADEIDADLIVIGTHGRRGLARALLGSVAENVIRTAKRPVLVIHGPRD
jgi:nucleotide-binding universal stress UspA family protein